MKLATLVIAVFTFVSPSFAECDATISSTTDTIGSVKGKLACFVAENAQLKKDAAKAKELRINTVRVPFLRAALSADACKAKAIDIVLKRGGKFVEQAITSVNVQLGDTAVSIICDALPPAQFPPPDKQLTFGFVIAASNDVDDALRKDLITGLAATIFPMP
jgi:hypothetical protein